MSDLIRIPKTFLDDHQSRDLEMPVIVKETKTHYFIRSDDPAMPELLSDAEYYASEYKYMDPYYFGLGRSAVATVKALRAK